MEAFVERGRADARCRQLNLQKRAAANPFEYMPEVTSGAFFDQYTTLGEAAFLKLLQAEGLNPPAHTLNSSADYDDLARVWADWWEKHRKGWDDRLVERLWDALDRVYFYEVAEVGLEP